MIDKSPLQLLFGKREMETLQKKQEGKPLTQTERNYLSASIRPKLRAIQALAPLHLLPDINRRKEHFSRQDIIFNLGEYGYELIAISSLGKKKKISLEELIMQVLRNFPESRFIEAIPILLLKNPIDPFKLLELATLWHLKNQLGFLLETALSLQKRSDVRSNKLSDLLYYLQKTKEPERHLLGEDFGKEYREFLARASSPRMQVWHLLGRFFDEDFKTGARVYL